MDSLPLPALLDTWTAPAVVPSPYQPYPTAPALPRALTHLCTWVPFGVQWRLTTLLEPKKLMRDGERLPGSQRGRCWL